MASDISTIITSELLNTFESLLSLKTTIKSISSIGQESLKEEKYIKISFDVETESNIKSNIIFILPSFISTKLEYLMLGGIGDIKTTLDDEILDATQEILNTVTNGVTTTVNAQDFEDLQDISFQNNEAIIITNEDLKDINNIYKIELLFNTEPVEFFMIIGEPLLIFVEKLISGQYRQEIKNKKSQENKQIIQNNSLFSMLGEESTENLKLLFNVKLKLSVRLGTKTLLLKDIVNWDIGHIIELEQIVNEPLDILINGTKIGEGEAVIVEGRFGVKIRSIGEKRLDL